MYGDITESKNEWKTVGVVRHRIPLYHEFNSNDANTKFWA